MIICHESFFITLRIISNGITVDASNITLSTSLKLNGTLLNTSPPKYIISIWITDTDESIIKNGLFLLIPEKNDSLSERVLKQLKIPENVLW